MNVGLLILRVIIGALFVGHGAQKLFGWFNGHGINGTAGFMKSLRIRNGRVAAVITGLSESVGGLMLVLGFLTPLASAGIIGVMVGAMALVHLRNGLWNTGGGIELPLVYSVAAAVLAFTGPGRFSLDRVLGWHIAGPAYGVGAILIGIAVGLVALTVLRSTVSRTSAGGDVEK